MTINTAADIAGANGKVALGTNAQQARRIWITAHGSSNARFGDTNVSSTRGVELAADVQYVFSASDADISDRINLANAFCYVPSGTTITLAWGS